MLEQVSCEPTGPSIGEMFTIATAALRDIMFWGTITAMGAVIVFKILL